MTSKARTVLHGIDQSGATPPNQGNWASRWYDEALRCFWVWDETAGTWLPDGILNFVYDPAVSGGTAAAHNLLRPNGQPLIIPPDTLIIDGGLVVQKPFYAAGAATLSLGVEGTTDLLGSTAFSVLDVGYKAKLVPVAATASTWILSTAARSIVATVGTAKITSGKLYGWLRCMNVPTHPILTSSSSG
jgi:hypothetical protein